MWNKLNKNKSRKPARVARQFIPRLQLLEDRLVPASTLDFMDVDGDRVVVTSTRGNLTGKLATFAAAGAGVQLQALDLTDAAFQGAAIATRVARAPGGDGLVNIGRINATGRDLASVVVKGDLGAIDVGDGDTATPALGLLTVRSMGRYGLATQDAFTANLVSNLAGALGALRVAGDVREASILVTDPVGTAGRIGLVVIGGSLVGGSDNQSGSVFAEDGIGRVTIRGDIIGGSGQTSGSVRSTGDLAGVTVGGSVLGGPGFTSGVIFSSQGSVGPVRVGRDIAGGTATFTGRVFGATGIASVTVGGSLLGGTANDSGRIHSDRMIGPVRIGGDIRGGTPFTGNIESSSQLASLTVGGSVVGADDFSGFVRAAYLGPIRIGRDLVGGSGQESGWISSFIGPMDSLAIGGSIVGGAGAFSGAVNAPVVGPVRIGGDLRGGSGASSGHVRSEASDIGPVSIGGDVVRGSGPLAGEIRAHASVGPVSIGGDLSGAIKSITGGGMGWVRIGGDLSSGIVESAGDLAGLTVGGSVVGGSVDWSGSVDVRGDLGPVSIGGDLVGGSGHDSGKISSSGQIASLTVGGSVLGGAGSQDVTTINSVLHSGQVFAVKDIGRVRVGGDVIGGDGEATAQIRSGANLASVTIGGSLVGRAPHSGQLASGDMGPVRIGRDLVGGPSEFTGVIFTRNLAALTVGGSVLGGAASLSGAVSAYGNLGAVRIGGDLRGGSITGTQFNMFSSGYIEGGRIASVFVGGSIVSGTDSSTGGGLTKNASIRAHNDLGPVVIRGSLVGNPTCPVVISARGQPGAPSPEATADLAIRSLTIGGRVEWANVLAGYNVDLGPVYGNASVGVVRVGGDWIASSLAAGLRDTNGDGFGNGDDALINNDGDAIVARIASVTIGGVVAGTAGDTDHFGFVAEQIGSFQVGGVGVRLTTGPDVIELSPTTGDVTVREV